MLLCLLLYCQARLLFADKEHDSIMKDVDINVLAESILEPIR